MCPFKWESVWVLYRNDTFSTKNSFSKYGFNHTKLQICSAKVKEKANYCRRFFHVLMVPIVEESEKTGLKY